jgi:hypothetical protein
MLSHTSWSQFLGGCLLLISSPYLVLAANHDVNVAQTGLTYSPDHLDNVAAQDTVTFHWLSGPHSATQGTLEAPCTALSGGLDSGLYVPLSHIPGLDRKTDLIIIYFGNIFTDSQLEIPILSRSPSMIRIPSGSTVKFLDIVNQEW